MIIKSAEYTASYVDVNKCPKDEKPEFAFVGRSNVGKSSIINMLMGRRKLSKVSNTPGKTQCLNFFDINGGQFNLVDLPGYGYAKISQTQRDKWTKMIKDYVVNRKQLMYVCQLIDSRVPPQKSDLDFINMLGQNNVPFIILFTKADKPGAKEVITNVQDFKNALLKHWEELPPMIITSSEKAVGREQVLDFLEDTVNEYYKTIKSNNPA